MTPIGRNTLLAFPAVWISGPTAVKPSLRNRLDHGIPLEGVGTYYDIRGRRIGSNVMPTQKLYSGVYYIITPDGVMKRIIVGH